MLGVCDFWGYDRAVLEGLKMSGVLLTGSVLMIEWC
jgi:hypothetical protein